MATNGVIGAPSATASYAYDPLSRRTGVTRLNGAGSAYVYEDDGDLAQVAHAPTVGAALSFTYATNPSGQIGSVATSQAALQWAAPGVGGQPGGPSGYGRIYGVANALNQMSSESANPIVWDAPTGPNSGNMESASLDGSADRTNFTHDGMNRLVTASRTGMAAAYAYDADDRRVSKVVTQGPTTITRTLWSGIDELAEYDGAGALLRRVIPGPGIDDRVAVVEAPSGAVRYFHTDRLGSVVALTDAAGAATDTYAYSPFGESSAALTGNPWRYTGRYLDAETGLYYYRARYYSARLGQFLQTDPVGYQDDMNLYAYVHNDPLNLYDPTGQNCVGDGTTYNCDPPGDDTAPYQIPQMEGAPNEIGDTQPLSHQYRAETSTPDSNGSLAPDIANQIIANPTPGVDQPASPGGTLNDAGVTPGTGGLGDQVRSYVTTDANGNTVVVNVTVPGQHMLAPGVVSQYIIPGQTSTSVIAVGEGNGWFSIPTAPIAQGVFQNKIERDVRIGVSNAVRGGRW